MHVRFGEFTLDTDTRQLIGSKGEIHLSPKAYELLRALVENRPRALSKNELHGHLWPVTFVSEVNLATLIAEIREALADDPLTEIMTPFDGPTSPITASNSPTAAGRRGPWGSRNLHRAGSCSRGIAR